MKISLNWLKKYVKIPNNVSDDELIRLIGARLVEVEGVINETHKYDSIYVVRVESCEKIPNTHLTVCQINAGGPELVQVVCGAPNVHEGMMAVWIAPGAIVPASAKEDAPFTIGKRKMQGFESCGMLAGADELDFGDDHSGIVEIEPELAKPGDLLADIFELNDLVLEIENKSLTHRPDCFGIVGFAREVAGILGEKFIEPDFKPVGFELSINEPVSVSIEDSNICSRYSALLLEKHGELQKKYLSWQDTVLSKSGMKPISPIVDATNYLMLLTGQPLHAFDYDKFLEAGKSDKARIVVRLAKDGEKITLLDDTEVQLNESDIVICSNDTPVALAGAMGGKSTMIDENTRNIIIESATFSLYNLRKTQMAHGIFSEAITRFTKGQPAYQTMTVANLCARMLTNGFRVFGKADEYPKPSKEIVVKITTQEINALLGTKYDRDLIIKTLSNVGFVVKKFREELSIVVPEWRTDIHIKEDVIEEVGRLLGYDNIDLTLPLHSTSTPNNWLETKKIARNLLLRLGANELLTYSFVSSKLLEKAGQDLNNSYRIVNSISPELQFIRQSLVPSLLDKAYKNEKLPVEKFAIYEINKIYRKEFKLDKDGVPFEKLSFGLVIAERKGTGTAYYMAKKYLAKVLEEFGLKGEFISLIHDTAEARPFEPKRSAEVFVNGEYLGVVGEFKNSVRNAFKLAPYLAGFEIDFDVIMKYASRKKTISLAEYNDEDLTVTTTESYDDALKKVRKDYPDSIITPGTIYQAEGQKDRNITFHIRSKID